MTYPISRAALLLVLLLGALPALAHVDHDAHVHEFFEGIALPFTASELSLALLVALLVTGLLYLGRRYFRR